MGGPPEPARRESASLADILERVLDKGIVIAGDIQINLLDIELLTIKLRLLIASVDTGQGDGHRLVGARPLLSSGPATSSTRTSGCGGALGELESGHDARRRRSAG